MGRLAFATWSVAMSGLLFACEMAEPPADPSARLQQPGADLALGATGEDVRAVNEYLRRYGYFPNEELGRRYPSWRPIVSQGPGRTNLFDEQTQAAIRALQANLGLPVTGTVNEATRGALAQGRCGVPDGLRPQNAGLKFAKQGSKWPTTNVTWRVTNTDDVTIEQARAAAAAAFAAWAAETTLTFTQVTSGEDITITFNTLPDIFTGAANGPGGDLARNRFPEFGGDMEIDVAETWSVAATPPAGAFSLRDVMTHEIGHGLGLFHSGNGSAVVMHPLVASGTAARPLHVDDKVGISSIYDTWFNLPGAGKDIAVGADGSAWVIGTGPVVGGNFAIHKWNEATSSWQASDGGAVRIAVAPNGVPWVVNAAGAIFKRTSSSPTSGFWQGMPGGARDIGIGGTTGDGSVWVIGTAAIPGGFEIFKFNGSGWDKSNGGAVKISVDSAGVPWVTASDGRIFRRDSNSATSGNWEEMPGGGNDIGIGPANYPYLIGRGAIPGGFEIWLWDQQPQNGTAPMMREWVKLPGGAVTVAVGPNARPWVINSSGLIFRSFK